MPAGFDKLTSGQRELLNVWLPSATVRRDHSWGLVGTLVFELEHDETRYIAKAGDARDHHIARELKAHREWLEPWTSRQRAPLLVHGDIDAKLLLCNYLEGELVQGSPHEWSAEPYRQAGELLALVHQQLSVEDSTYEARHNDRALTWLSSSHLIAPDVVAQLRQEIESWPTPSAQVVPTHGDWQPRNWLTHDGRISVIDFGRADLRPAYTDLARLEAQQFRTDPALKAVFLQGYGGDPRDPEPAQRNRVREAIATAVWAHQVGDQPFEQQGLRMIDEAMART